MQHAPYVTSLRQTAEAGQSRHEKAKSIVRYWFKSGMFLLAMHSVHPSALPEHKDLLDLCKLPEDRRHRASEHQQPLGHLKRYLFGFAQQDSPNGFVDLPRKVHSHRRCFKGPHPLQNMHRLPLDYSLEVSERVRSPLPAPHSPKSKLESTTPRYVVEAFAQAARARQLDQSKLLQKNQHSQFNTLSFSIMASGPRLCGAAHSAAITIITIMIVIGFDLARPPLP